MNKRGSLEDLQRLKGRRVRRSFIWDVGASLGLVSSVVVIVGAAVIVSTGRLEIRHNLSRLAPAWVRSYFERESHIAAPPDVAEVAAELLKKAAPNQHKRVGQPNIFGVGDSQEVVAKLQGQPTKKAGGVWYYGESTVTFVAGRVVSWSESSANPLRVR